MTHSIPTIRAEDELHQAMRTWRRDFHAHPETAFEEHRTAGIIAELLISWGLEVHTGIAETGVVGVLRGRHAGCGSVGLRADMDALDMEELNDFAHASTVPGKMHGCGHDGHSAMLLGAAKHLAEHPDFAGTVVFIFQPAEEGRAGAQKMCEQGLFDRFPVDAVYGLHNWPGLPVGEFAAHSGPVMAAMDVFDITIYGAGCHGAMPHLGIDPVAVAGQLIGALQSVISRNLDPLQAGVVSVTQMHGGDAYNVVPDKVVLSGTCRSFSPETQALIESRMTALVVQLCGAFGARGELDYRHGYPATINNSAQSADCAAVAVALLGDAAVHRNHAPSMGAEDFAFMLQQQVGAYLWLGNGSTEGGCVLHNPRYDFNDDILPLGANYWVALVSAKLAPQ